MVYKVRLSAKNCLSGLRLIIFDYFWDAFPGTEAVIDIVVYETLDVAGQTPSLSDFLTSSHLAFGTAVKESH